MPFLLSWTLVLAIPTLLLAIAGVLLWRRRHSAATLLTGAGFTVALLGLLSSLVESIEARSILRGQPNTWFWEPHFHALMQVMHWAGLLGFWAAAVGLLLHAAREH